MPFRLLGSRLREPFCAFGLNFGFIVVLPVSRSRLAFWPPISLFGKIWSCFLRRTQVAFSVLRSCLVASFGSVRMFVSVSLYLSVCILVLVSLCLSVCSLVFGFAVSFCLNV